MRAIKRPLKGFIDFRLRFIIGAPATLFHHHLDFLLEFLGIDIQMPHPIRLERHDIFQSLVWHLLKISGVITTGKSVLSFRSSCFQSAIKLPFLHIFGLLEHHMFKKVGQAGSMLYFIA